METREKLINDIETKIAIEIDNVKAQGELLSNVAPQVIVEHIIHAIKEQYHFRIHLADVHGKVEIFNEDKSGEGGILHRFAMISYPIDLQYASPAVFEILRQSTHTDMELSKEHLAVFVPLAEETVDQIDLGGAYQLVEQFVVETNQLAQDVQLDIAGFEDQIRVRMIALHADEQQPTLPSTSLPNDQPLA